MKKTFLILTVLLLTLSTILVVKTGNSVSSFDLNVEALADGESSSICYHLSAVMMKHWLMLEHSNLSFMY